MHSYSLTHRINLEALLDDSNGKQNIFFMEAQFCKMLRSSCKAQGDLEFHRLSKIDVMSTLKSKPHFFVYLLSTVA